MSAEAPVRSDPGEPAGSIRETAETADSFDTGPRRNLWALLGGPLAGLVLALVLPSSLAFEGRAVAGCALWMAIWWMTEAAPIPVTSMLPLVLFPLFGMDTMENVAAPYASSVVFLVLGGVILGLATEKSQLHLRIALLTIRAMGTKPSQIVFGMMLASAFISAWVSNTATAVIMVPIGVSILQLVRSIDKDAVDTKFAASMMLGIAYGVTVGSMATLIGQPPMALMKAYMASELGYDMGFGQWMLVGVPFAAVMLVLAWLVLTKLVFRSSMTEIPGGADLIRDELAKLGRMTTPERRVSAIFAAAIFCWVAVPFIAAIPAVEAALPFLGKISDTQVAMAAAIACFLVPAQKRSEAKGSAPLLGWGSARDIPWGLLLLFGGGLSLSAMFTQTGLSQWIGTQVGALQGMPPVVILLIAAIVGLGLTELTSNTATAAAFFPIMGAVAVGIGMDPVLMTIVMTLAVCSAFMLPVATPSNAVAFGTGEVSIKQMVRAGVWLNLVAIVLIVVTLYTLLPLAFGISI
ncbi:SLC13 family permease [Paeniglutamicibacter sp. ORCA_105]|uniref:SLC13 family permease n=1 Tax=Paeniglutamicibacter sp. ORCA_105 TaxID=3377336 RepID=UPI0038934E9E